MISYLKEKIRKNKERKILNSHKDIVYDFIKYCEKYNIKLKYIDNKKLEISSLIDNKESTVEYHIIDGKMHIDYNEQHIIVRNGFRKLIASSYNHEDEDICSDLLFDSFKKIKNFKNLIEVDYKHPNNNYYIIDENTNIEDIYDIICSFGFYFYKGQITIKTFLKFMSSSENPFQDIKNSYLNIRIVLEESLTPKSSFIKIYSGTYNNEIYSMDFSYLKETDRIIRLIYLLYGMNLTKEGNDVLQLNHWSEFNEEHLETLKLITY